MARGKRYQPEQVVNLLGQIEVAVANGNLRQNPSGSFLVGSCGGNVGKLKEREITKLQFHPP